MTQIIYISFHIVSVSFTPPFSWIYSYVHPIMKIIPPDWPQAAHEVLQLAAAAVFASANDHDLHTSGLIQTETKDVFMAAVHSYFGFIWSCWLIRPVRNCFSKLRSFNESSMTDGRNFHLNHSDLIRNTRNTRLETLETLETVRKVSISQQEILFASKQGSFRSFYCLKKCRTPSQQSFKWWGTITKFPVSVKH